MRRSCEGGIQLKSLDFSSERSWVIRSKGSEHRQKIKGRVRLRNRMTCTHWINVENKHKHQGFLSSWSHVFCWSLRVWGSEVPMKIHEACQTPPHHSTLLPHNITRNIDIDLYRRPRWVLARCWYYCIGYWKSCMYFSSVREIRDTIGRCRSY